MSGLSSSTRQNAAALCSQSLVAFDQRIRAVIVDRLEVLGFEHVCHHTLVRIETLRDVTDEILDELRVLVSALGDELLVRTLQQAPQLARRLFLGDADQRLDRQVGRGSASIVTCERWLCAPYCEIFFEHGHRLVTGTSTFRNRRVSPLRLSPASVTS